MCGAIGQGTWSLFAALGSHIISFANSTMFLADEKGKLAKNDKTIPSISFKWPENGMLELTGNVFSDNMNSLYSGCKPWAEIEVDWAAKERFVFFNMYCTTCLLGSQL